MKPKSTRTYFLHSPEHTRHLQKEIAGTVAAMPERVFTVEARALYKVVYGPGSNGFFIDTYPIPAEKCLRLYTVKTLPTVIRVRSRLYEDCGEWFDICELGGGKADVEGGGSVFAGAGQPGS